MSFLSSFFLCLSQSLSSVAATHASSESSCSKEAQLVLASVFARRILDGYMAQILSCRGMICVPGWTLEIIWRCECDEATD